MLFVTWVQYYPIKVIDESLKSPEDVPMRRPATYFVTVFKRLTYSKLPKTLNFSQYIMSFVTGVQYHPIKVIDESLKSSEDVPIKRPATYFVTVLKRLTQPNLPKTLNFSQYIMLFVTGVQYHPIIVIDESMKSSEDVPMRRPATYFVTAFKRLTSQNLPKTLNISQYIM